MELTIEPRWSGAAIQICTGTFKFDDCSSEIIVKCEVRIPKVLLGRALAPNWRQVRLSTAVASLPEVHRSATDPSGELQISIPHDVSAQLVPVIAVSLRPS